MTDSTPTPAQTLAAAADRLEVLLSHRDLLGGVWRAEPVSTGGDWPSTYIATDVAIERFPVPTEQDAAYIVAMQPAVGQAMVALFRCCVWMLDLDPYLVGQSSMDEVMDLARALLASRPKDGEPHV